MADPESSTEVQSEKKSRKDGAYMRHSMLPRKCGRPLPPMPWSMNIDDHLNGIEREYTMRALRDSGGVIAQAARMLGVKRSGLDFRIRKLGIDLASYRPRKKTSCER